MTARPILNPAAAMTDQLGGRFPNRLETRRTANLLVRSDELECLQMNLGHAVSALDRGAPDAPASMTSEEYANLAVLVASVRDDAANLLEWAASIEQNANRLYRELTFGE